MDPHADHYRCLFFCLFFVVWREDIFSLTWLCSVSFSNYTCFSAGPLRPITATAPLLVGLSLAARLQPEAPVAAPLAITPQERETNTHTHSLRHTQTNKQWLQASLTGCLIASQELIIRLEKIWCHQSCVLMCVNMRMPSCLCAHAQSLRQVSCVRESNCRLSRPSRVCGYKNTSFHKSLPALHYHHFLHNKLQWNRVSLTVCNKPQ